MNLETKLVVMVALVYGIFPSTCALGDEIREGLTAQQWNNTNCRYVSQISAFHGFLGNQSELRICLFLQKAMILANLISVPQWKFQDEGAIEFRLSRTHEFLRCPYKVREPFAISKATSAYLIGWRNMRIGGTYKDGLTSTIEQEIEENVETSCPSN